MYNKVIFGTIMPDGKVVVGNFGEIPLVTIGDITHPRFSWLLNQNHTMETLLISSKKILIKFFSTRVVMTCRKVDGGFYLNALNAGCLILGILLWRLLSFSKCAYLFRIHANQDRNFMLKISALLGST